jgi:uncharacterized protein
MKKENKQLRWITVWFVLLPLCLAVKAQGASFDCSKATTRIEKMICADAELSKIDEELASAYNEALKKVSDPAALKREQQVWLKERNACTDAACVKQVYESRLQGLSSSTDMPAPQGKKASTNESSAEPPAKKPLYGHCVDVGISGSCGEGQTGKGYTVCEKYLTYLNSLPDTPKCEIPIPPGFTEPVWEEVDFMQHLDWAYQIARKKFVGAETYKLMSFEQWKPFFLKDIAAGLLSPEMKKTRVKPIGDAFITLISFTEDKEGCKRPYDQTKKRNPVYSVWNGVGYCYFILTDDPAAPLVEIGGGLYSISFLIESILLLYADKPYFVTLWEPYASPFETTLHIRTFDPSQWRTIPEKNMYSTMKLCNFSPVVRYKPQKNQLNQ